MRATVTVPCVSAGLDRTFAALPRAARIDYESFGQTEAECNQATAYIPHIPPGSIGRSEIGKGHGHLGIEPRRFPVKIAAEHGEIVSVELARQTAGLRDGKAIRRQPRR